MAATFSPSVTSRRLVLGITRADQQVGHVNSDPLDCRRENLIVRTPTQRSYTQRKRTMVAGRRTTSRFKGVYWKWEIKRWCARIRCEGKTRMLGNFRDEIAAALAYDEAARQWFGEHAWLNFPEGIDAWLAARAEETEATEKAAA